MNYRTLCFAAMLACLPCLTQPLHAAATTQPAVGEQVPSDDPVLKDLHSLGLVNGQLNLFRLACPVRDIAKSMTATRPTADQLTAGEVRMKRLYDLGVRTVFSFQDPATLSDDGKTDEDVAISLERSASAAVGIRFISRPIANAGPNSLQTMTDRQVLEWLDPIVVEIFQAAQTGGVAFHCSAGHDRTGIVAAYIRLKYQHWPVDQAIDEMRRYGHNWPKYSANGGVSSWHEEHLRGIAELLNEQSPAPAK